jgi:hypothetical protein
VEVGNLVHFHVAIVEVEGQPQEAIKAITLRLEGEVYHERCVIGFLPRNIVIGMRDKFVNKTGQIVELYHLSDSAHKREMDHRNGGAAAFKLVDDIIAIALE